MINFSKTFPSSKTSFPHMKKKPLSKIVKKKKIKAAMGYNHKTTIVTSIKA
jgi:hypothetical protein